MRKITKISKKNNVFFCKILFIDFFSELICPVWLNLTDLRLGFGFPDFKNAFERNLTLIWSEYILKECSKNAADSDDCARRATKLCRAQQFAAQSSDVRSIIKRRLESVWIFLRVNCNKIFTKNEFISDNLQKRKRKKLLLNNHCKFKSSFECSSSSAWQKNLSWVE